VRVGDEVRVRQGLLERILEVKGILRRRVSAKEVEAFLIDLTPAEEYARVAELERDAREGAPIPRETGTGRPTKRDRRDLDEMSGGETAPEPTFEDFVRAFVRRKPTR
jgi:ribosome-associated heat shock protein Hsp15